MDINLCLWYINDVYYFLHEENVMYYFIVNPGSQTGKAKTLWADLEKRLKSSDIDYKVYFTGKKNDAEKFARSICEEHPEMKRIVIAGGDGTANEAINGLTGYDNFILGYIPMGSSNDLARGLGIPQEPLQVIENTIHPRRFIRVDHGLVISEDGSIVRKFGVSSGMGYDADICKKALHSKLKKLLNNIGLGKLVYYLIGLALIFTNKPTKAVITIDGKRKIRTDRLIFAANMNTRYEGGGMPMGPAANPFDGKITVCIVHDISRFTHLRLMPSVIKGNHVKHKNIEQITAKTIEIQTDRPMTIHTDGEIAGESSHVTFSCFPEKARMII